MLKIESQIGFLKQFVLMKGQVALKQWRYSLFFFNERLSDKHGHTRCLICYNQIHSSCTFLPSIALFFWLDSLIQKIFHVSRKFLEKISRKYSIERLDLIWSGSWRILKIMIRTMGSEKGVQNHHRKWAEGRQSANKLWEFDSLNLA